MIEFIYRMMIDYSRVKVANINSWLFSKYDNHLREDNY